MKKIFLLPAFCLVMISLFAQETPETNKKKQSLAGRANDHFLFQLGVAGWAGKPDSIHTGFSKSINVYFMFDFPFKTNPHMSMAFGPGISSDNIQFKKTYVGIKDQTATLRFTDQSDTVHFKKTKLSTAYLEAPIEFRWVANPFDSDHSFKFALGVKVGALIAAHTRNKDLEAENGGVINPYVMKEISKRFFNTTRLSGQARVGWGHFSVYGSYQITALIKDGLGPEVRPYAIGLTLSGL
jgi:hypothetical protein